MIKRILVGLGGTPFSLTATKSAIELAQLHQATLTAVTIVDVRRLRNVGPVPVGAGHLAKEISDRRVSVTKENIEKAVTRFEDECKQAAVSFEIKREVGNPFDSVLFHWRYHDLTLMGLRGLFEYGVIATPLNAIVEMMRQGVRPILATSQHPREIKKVLIAYNGSMDSANAMKRFIQMRLWTQCRLHIACFNRPENEARALLAAAQDYCSSHGFDCDSHRIDEPAKQIMKYAQEWNVDLIVLGSSVKSLLRRKVFGDTTGFLIQNADRPLFISH